MVHSYPNGTIAMRKDGTLFAWGKNHKGQLGLGHHDNEPIPTQLPDPLEQAFIKGHQRLAFLKQNSNTFFSNTAVDPTTRFLSGSVLHPSETDQSRTQSTTVSMEKNKTSN